MKSAEARKLAFVFADSPKGDKNRDPQDESYGKRFLVHTAKAATAGRRLPLVQPPRGG